jgi:hypothetical protein
VGIPRFLRDFQARGKTAIEKLRRCVQDSEHQERRPHRSSHCSGQNHRLTVVAGRKVRCTPHLAGALFAQGQPGITCLFNRPRGGITGGMLEDASFVCVRTSGTTIEIATIQTRIVGVRNGLARKYLLGVVKIRASGNIRTLAVLKEQIVRARIYPSVSNWRRRKCSSQQVLAECQPQ